MEKTYTITEKQIREAHTEACSAWKNTIEGWWPEVFQSLTPNKWFSSSSTKYLIFAREVDKYGTVLSGFGFDDSGKWHDEVNKKMFFGTSCEEADAEKVHTALIAEAKKRYKEGDRVKSMYDGKEYSIDYKGLPLLENGDFRCFGVLLMKNGAWASIIPPAKEMTKEEIETALGFKIKIV